MQNQGSERVNRISVSQTLEMNKKTKELIAKGIDVINFCIGEPDFPTPLHIKDAAKKAIDDNFTFYTAVAGCPELLLAICGKLKRENNLDYKPDQIVVSNGAKQSIANVILTLINHGDEIIVPAPYWVSYVEIDNLAGGKNVFIESKIENDFKVTAEQIEKAITSKTRVLLYSSPSNPTGGVYSKEELKAIADVIAKYPNVYVISDEIYEHINYVGKHESIAQFDSIKDRVIVINGVSKGYAMTGWRIGYIAAPQWIAKACEKLQGQYTSSASSISQYAAIAALNGTQEPTNMMREAFKRRRDLIVNKLSEIKGLKCNIPQGAFYILPEISNFLGKSDGEMQIKTAYDLSMYLLTKAHISVMDGTAFGAPNCIRISFATSDENIVEGMNRMKTALEKLT